MRKSVFILPVLLCAMCSSVARSSVNNINFYREEPLNKNATAIKCFVQKTDGTIQYYSSIKLVTGIFITPYLLADGNIKLNSGTIKAYQNKEHYAISQQSLEAGHQSKVAKETLPGFAIRIAEGPLNIYSKKRFNGAIAVDEIFVQVGHDGEILPYSPELMQSLVKDHPEALELLKSKKKINPVSKKLQAVAALYNRSQMLTKN